MKGMTFLKLIKLNKIKYIQLDKMKINNESVTIVP